MLSKHNRAESDLIGYTVFGRQGLCLVPRNVPGKLYPVDIFPHSPSSLPITLLLVIIFD